MITWCLARVRWDRFRARFARARARGRARVLLVEEDVGVRDATRMLLRAEGYEVVPAARLADAVSLARFGQRIDLMVADYHLADGKTGLQVLAVLRDICGPGLRAVIATGDTSSTQRVLAQYSGVRVVDKPVKAEELLALIRELTAGVAEPAAH